LNVGMPSFINKHKWTKRDRGEQNNNRWQHPILNNS
jgi:hypothetical protein